MDKMELLKWMTAQLQPYSDTPALDARFLMEGTQNPSVLNEYIERRKLGEPVSKILGRRGFWTLDLKVTKDTLDPRPDSETLIDAVLKEFSDKEQSLWILDMGAGTGCLLLSLLSEYPNAMGVGVDASRDALAVASENGADCPHVNFVQKDWRDDNWMEGFGHFDIIVSNPPYIKTKDIEDLHESVRNYDPHLALDGGRDGLSAYRAIARNLPDLLKHGGRVFFEIGKGQEKDVTALMVRRGFTFVKSYKDLAGTIRCLVFRYGEDPEREEKDEGEE